MLLSDATCQAQAKNQHSDSEPGGSSPAAQWHVWEGICHIYGCKSKCMLNLCVSEFGLRMN